MSLSHKKANGKKRIQNNLSQPKKEGGGEGKRILQKNIGHYKGAKHLLLMIAQFLVSRCV